MEAALFAWAALSQATDSAARAGRLESLLPLGDLGSALSAGF